MFERAMRMFTPFGPGMGAWAGEKETPNPFAAAFGGGRPNASESSGAPQRDEEIRDLKDQLAAMRQQIADLAKRK